MDPADARLLWHRLETVNAVTYFCAECRAAPADLGLPGFWMGYFGCRAAPLGAVAPGVVVATFFNFHPGRVGRAVPEVWEHAHPDRLLATRAEAAARALRRLLGGDVAERLAADVLPTLEKTIERASGAGRPLFAANRDAATPSDPVAALWQAATTVREHRGDAHVALLTAADLDGCEALVLFAAGEGVDPELFQQSRGWSADEWGAATDRLADRGLVDVDGRLTPAGRELRDGIERRTDELAAVPFSDVSDEATERLLDDLRPAAETITIAGEISFPNPMGLPAVTGDR